MALYKFVFNLTLTASEMKASKLTKIKMIKNISLFLSSFSLLVNNSFFF